jgi:hypothetical protein
VELRGGNMSTTTLLEVREAYPYTLRYYISYNLYKR